MKKILIAINHMQVGGIQKALLELLKALGQVDEYSVDLFCCSHHGEYFDKIPESINVLPENSYAKISELSLDACKQMGKKYFLLRAIYSLKSKYFGKKASAKALCKRIGKIDGDYDIAISYSQPIQDESFCALTNEIVLHCVSAKKKATFVHCDFLSYGGNTAYNRSLYEKFDAVAAVSESVGRRLAEAIPSVVNRIYTVRNFCDIAEIYGLAERDAVEYAKRAVVTVARLSAEKGILRCIPAFARLKQDGVEFEWHIIGNGNLYKSIEEKIKEHGLEDCVFLEGQQLNPYRYIKNAAYMLLPSFHEAAPVVFDEAMALGVPILTTETLSAVEMVGNLGTGMVCKNDDESIFEMLRVALTDNELNFSNVIPDNAICMMQINKMINGEEV